jgi:teichuronic acid biosynthesis glycosyltransferase TuaC
MVKILFIASGNNKYGISPIVSNQAGSLINAGVEIDYFPIRGKGIGGYSKNILPLRKYLKKNQFDVIHAHYGFSGLVALLARRKEKVVISFMGSDLLFNGNDTFIHRLVFYTEVIINRLLTTFSYDFIIVKSEEMAKKLPGYTKKMVLPNGVNLDLFQPVQMQQAKEVLGLGRKNLILFASDPNRTEKNYPLAQKAISSLGTDDFEVICLTGIDHDKLKYYYSAASVLVLTSFHEGSPNVIKEAMACNCPIVSTNVGDVKELLEGVKGCFICTYDVRDVADKLRQAIEFQGRTNGREKIIKSGLDQKIIAQKLIDIYNRIKH